MRSPLKQPPRRPSKSPTKTGYEKPSSPLKKPPRRPSFASPTKSNLARNYPHLLSRHSPSPATPTAAQNGHGNNVANDREARAQDLGNKDRRVRLEQGSERNGHTRAANGTKTNNAKPHIQSPASGETEESELPVMSSHKSDPRDTFHSTPSNIPQNPSAPVEESSILPTSPTPARTVNKARGNADKEDLHERKKQPPDPELEQKKREKEKLTQELKELESQVSRCTKEIVKIQKQPPAHRLPPREREDLISFITKITETETEAEEDKSPSISNLLCSFLPFSSHAIPPPPSKEPITKPVPSHRPLDLEDPLPYLQMFTNFTIQTHLDLPDSKPAATSDRIHQKHTITMTGPQQLLTASLILTIDVPTTTIADLQITHLSPWAERDLGAFMREKALEQNLSNACWAVESYWDIARKRAEHWHRCETAFAHLLPGRAREDAENVTPQHRQSSSGAKITTRRRDLKRLLGRDVLVLQDRHVVLQLDWKIGFDWTGEANSTVGVRAAVPRVCKFLRYPPSPC